MLLEAYLFINVCLLVLHEILITRGKIHQYKTHLLLVCEPFIHILFHVL